MDQPESSRPPRGYCWMPTLALAPGMVVARPVLGGAGVHAAIHLAPGSEITANTISQLINKGIECVAVIQAPTEDEAAHAAAVRQYEERLHEIFGPDPDQNCRPLLDALLADGPG